MFQNQKTVTYIKLAVIAVCVLLSLVFVVCVGMSPVTSAEGASTEVEIPSVQIFEILNAMVDEGKQAALSVYKKFWIKEGDPLPKRDDTKYGTANDPKELAWLLEEAAPLLQGQEMLFTTETPIRESTVINYYYDESILAIAWQQIIDRAIYTIAEVKINDPSQFRRYLIDDMYGSKRLMTTTNIAAQAGAVIAGSGDHFRGRKEGIVVYDGEVKRFKGQNIIDNCFVDTDGNLHLTPKGTFTTQEEVETYIRENNIDFGLAFGPILVQDGKKANPDFYGLGEVLDNYPRAALCQKDELHYLIVTVNGRGANINYPTIDMFATEIEKFNVQTAYTTDGGQTGAIAMQDQLINPNEYKTGQRAIGDIYIFHTAIPDHDGTESTTNE